MSASTHRPSPRSTLPAFPVQRRSRSPPSGSVPSSSHLRRSLSPKGVRLPPIQSLDFAPRPAPREPLSSQSLGTPLQDHYPHTSDPQFSSRNLKRAAAASSVGIDIGQSPYKRRRTDDLNDVPQHTNSHVSATTTPGPESHAHNVTKKGHKSLTPMDHPPLNNSQRSTPPNPADSRPGLLSRASSSSARTPSHSRAPSWQQQGALPLPQQPPVPPKVEQPSPPSLYLASGTTTSTTQWPSEVSFSRRLSQSTSGHRTTSRKQPPTRLMLQPQGSQQPAARSLQPAIQSAPPIPMQGGPPNMMRPQGPWIPERVRNNAPGGHPSVVGGPSTSISTTNNILNAEAIAAPAIRSTARHGVAAYPALPTPTSLRLGALQQQQQQQLHPLHPPLQTGANPNAAFPNSPSPYGYRNPITPVPSPLPVLGSGAGVSDKAKFMSKMSEIYDRATSHKNCVSIEEVDRRIKDATNGMQQETLALRKEVSALRKLMVRKERSVEIGDGDGDVNMESMLPPTTAGDGPAATTLTGPVLPELPRIEPPTPQSERPSVPDALAATINGRAVVSEKGKGKGKERDSPKDMISDKETPPK